MKKLSKWALPIIFGWFFAVQTPHQTEGVVITTVVGSFSSEQACKADLDEMKAMLEAFGMQFRVSPCTYRQEV